MFQEGVGVNSQHGAVKQPDSESLMKALREPKRSRGQKM